MAEALGRLAAPLPGVRLLMTVRSDFLGRVAGLPGLGEVLVRAIYVLRPLTPPKIREAIVGPAEAKGTTFASEALISALVEEAARTTGGLLARCASRWAGTASLTCGGSGSTFFTANGFSAPLSTRALLRNASAENKD